MLQLQEIGDQYLVGYDGKLIGTIRLSDNPFHKSNCYLVPELTDPDPNISAELFSTISKMVGRPLQVMVSSADIAMTSFLQAGGFCCRRKCYGVEAGAAEYIGAPAELPLMCSYFGEPDYETACCLMYAHYVSVHEAINPWTADFAAFCEALPKQVYFWKKEEAIVAAAFIEDNEIAYFCGTDRQNFLPFACSLLSSMLAEYPTVCFESDDCDWAAMTMKSLFLDQNDLSFDTYILTGSCRIELERELSGTILDIGGGGEGVIGRVYKQQVTAIDNCQEELDDSLGDCRKVLMDATDLRYGEFTFDHVTSFFTLMYMRAEEQRKAILEASRVLKNGGRLHIWDCEIASAYPEPFCIELNISLPDAQISTTYGIGKKDAQSRVSITQLCKDAGLRSVTQCGDASWFYLCFEKVCDPG